MNKQFALIISGTTILLIVLLFVLSAFQMKPGIDTFTDKIVMPTNSPVTRNFTNSPIIQNLGPVPTLSPEKQEAVFEVQTYLPFSSDALAVDYSMLTNSIYIQKKNDKADEDLQKFLVSNKLSDIYKNNPDLFLFISSNISQRIRAENFELMGPPDSDLTDVVSPPPSPTTNPHDPTSQALPLMNALKTLMGLNTTILPYSNTTPRSDSQTISQTSTPQLPISSDQLTAAQIGSYKLRGQQYDWGPYRCINPPGQQPGAKAIQAFINTHWGGGTGYIGNCTTSNGKYSIHAEGRAVDTFFHAGRPDELKKGNEAFAWMISNASNIGLQYIKYWRVQWTPGTGIFCVDNVGNGDPHDQYNHSNHIHFELNWKGANQQTPFFTQGAINPSTIKIDQTICPQLDSRTK